MKNIKKKIVETIITIAALPAFSFAIVGCVFIASLQSLYLNPVINSTQKMIIPAISILVSACMLLIAAGLSYRIMLLKPESYKIQANQAVMAFMFGSISVMEYFWEVTLTFGVFIALTYTGWEIGRKIYEIGYEPNQRFYDMLKTPK